VQLPAQHATVLLYMLQFRKLGYETVDMICDYMKSVPDAKVVPDVQVRAALTYTLCLHNISMGAVATADAMPHSIPDLCS
jgi:hypothetical protein